MLRAAASFLELGLNPSRTKIGPRFQAELPADGEVSVERGERLASPWKRRRVRRCATPGCRLADLHLGPHSSELGKRRRCVSLQSVHVDVLCPQREEEESSVTQLASDA